LEEDSAFWYDWWASLSENSPSGFREYIASKSILPMPRKLLLLITEDRFLWSHRLPIARAALQAGYEVIIATRVVGDAQRIRNEGFRLIPLRLDRESYAPLNEMRAIQELRQIYATEKPDIVHHVALKPVLYGSVAALGKKNIKVVNALTGLGYLATASSLKARFLRMPIWNSLRFLLNRPNCKVLLQNQEDKQLLVSRLKVSPEKITIIRGSGVDMRLFRPSPEPAGIPVILLASRMLWIKGVVEFVQAAKLIRKKGLQVRFVLAGDTDLRSPSCIPREQLVEWQASGAVEWWGHQPDLSQTFRQAHIVCLPSHGGEGVPKVLIEAAASGRAIVTTDVPGCRDIVRQGVSGILVPPRDAVFLAKAFLELLENPSLREQMAKRGREIAANEFSEEMVVCETIALYRELSN
jgi:glycosyltransferase involved in cell wall biosynthesis